MNMPMILAVLLFMISTYTTAWGAPRTAYVAEFSVSGASRPEDMKATIQTLLLSRLASDKLATQAKPEGAEIKVSGSYLLSGTVFSLDAVAVNSAGAVIARAFTQGKSPDDLIPAVGVLAKSLSEGIDTRIASAGPPRTAPLPADIVAPVRVVATAGQIVLKLEGALNGIAIGRTFANGDRELFVTGNHVLRYYRQGPELKLLAEIPYKIHEKILAVDTADLYNDTIPEIYLTIMDGEKLVSQVWTVDGATLKKVAGPLPYYFRAVTGAGGAKKLYAQQISGTTDFSGDVAELVKSGESYVLRNPVKLPKPGYLYNFGMLTGLKGERNAVVADKSGYLRVFTSADDELWKSGEEYGGSESSFNRIDRGRENGYRQVYLDQRIVVKANGELLVPKNSESWFMHGKHYYSGNSLYCFAWDGANLVEKWHTKQDDYYLADYAYDEAARELLMLEVVTKEDGIFDTGASRLVIRRVD